MPHAIPHSVFLGRIVRPGRDPQWTELDRGYALAWQVNKAETCSGCGTRQDEWEEDRDAYVGAVTFCRGHQVLAEAQKAVPKDSNGTPVPGWFAHLRPAPADDEDDDPPPDD